MDSTQRGILTLIRSGLTGKAFPLPAEFDLEKAYPILTRHEMSALAYEGAMHCGLSKQLPQMRQMFASFCAALMRSERQMGAIERICIAFEQAGIDYMPMKGCNLKKLYPRPELRAMDDADILIRLGQYDKIRPILHELGYIDLGESDHELRWSSKELYLELHKRLVATKEKEFFSYFGDGWLHAKREERTGYRYCFSKEDELLFQTMHFAKHYRESGIGLKHAVDFWVFTQAHNDLNQEYLHAELEKMHLWEFYQNILRMVAVWFDDMPSDEKTEFMTDMLFRRGMFDAYQNRIISDAIGSVKVHGEDMKNVRFRWVLDRIFPSYSELSKQYNILKRYPVLLPFVWVIRWGTILLFQRERLAGKRNNLKNLSIDRVETYQQALNYVGLDFNFKE